MAANNTTTPQLPCDGEGNCMACRKTPPEAETLRCKTCATPWHVDCLASPPKSLSSVGQWDCPDCDPAAASFSSPPAAVTSGGELVVAIKAIEADTSLSDKEKARKRQELLSGNARSEEENENSAKGCDKRDDNEILSIFGENMKCSFCMLLPERPVTTPCGHNFCLKCFEKWVKQGKKTCAKCRNSIPSKMLTQPKINAALVLAIRVARAPQIAAQNEAPRLLHFVDDEERPDKAFTTSRAKRSGNANAKSGRIFVTIPGDHLGPILAEHDPVNHTGVLVGDRWSDRLACRQWGAHFPHVSGIAGQSGYGAQSVVLSGGYEDDEDHGEWFLYTGSGGRDLSGNKRTNKLQSSDQTFVKGNESLRLSCIKGYPIRVVRSSKDKHSNYAPDEGVRYDGIYRIEKCWRSNGNQGFKVCRYLFVRCDNRPAPWTGDEHGDRPRPLPNIPELNGAINITTRKESPHWDFDEDEGIWKWKKPPPPTRETGKVRGAGKVRSVKRNIKAKKSDKEKILREFSCLLCRKVMTLPVTTPCAHNFCKSCLDGAFSGQAFVTERNRGGRQLRTQKNVMKCPSCSNDISDFLQNAQVNTELMGAIESITQKLAEEEKEEAEEVPDADVESEDEDDDASEEGLEMGVPEEEGVSLQSKKTKGSVIEEVAETNGTVEEEKGVVSVESEDEDDDASEEGLEKGVPEEEGVSQQSKKTKVSVIEFAEPKGTVEEDKRVESDEACLKKKHIQKKETPAAVGRSKKRGPPAPISPGTRKSPRKHSTKTAS